MGPVPSGDYVFLTVDDHSQFFEIEFIDIWQYMWEDCNTAVQDFCHDLPLSLRTDNESKFISGHFKKYLEKNEIEHR